MISFRCHGIAAALNDSLRSRVARLYVGLIAFNLLVWIWSFWAFHAQPTLLGAAILAYTFGLRHGVDADHIAAIDNVTRKLMQSGGRPIGVGLFFALGHSSVVTATFVFLALGAAGLAGRLQGFAELARSIGTGISTTFLFAIALSNILVLLGVWRTFQRLRLGEQCADEDLDALLAGRGLLVRLFRPAFRLVSASWHMYPLGVLFGLGFDTATEIAVLGMSAAGVAQGASLWSLLALPAMFTAGMTLVDTTDSVVMLGAYGWTFAMPIRKLTYNLITTLVSVVIAIAIGGIEALGLIGHELGLTRGVWGIVATLNDNFGGLGSVVVGSFVLIFVASATVYRVQGSGWNAGRLRRMPGKIGPALRDR